MSDVALVIEFDHYHFEGGLRPPESFIELLVGRCVRCLMLCLSSDVTTAILKKTDFGRLNLLITLLVGCCVRWPTLLLSSDATTVILKAAFGRLNF